MAIADVLRSDVPYRMREGGIIDTLTNPSPDVVQELRAVMREQGVDVPIDEWTVRQSDHWETFEARRERTDGEFGDYYVMTDLNFRQAVSRVSVHSGMRVLEIGANLDLHFLQFFHARGAECYATNIYFHYREPSDEAWAHRVLADMNDLPYADGIFDVVLLSATTHHSPDLDRTVREIARVAKPGASILILNDQVHGLLKHAWDRFGKDLHRGHHRDGEVHENEYAPGTYRRLFRKYGLHVISAPFPAHYALRLERCAVEGVRFAPLARLVAFAWRLRAVRTMLIRAFPAVQAVLGLQMNVVLRKSA